MPGASLTTLLGAYGADIVDITDTWAGP
ncbi:hypothetical protein SMD44_03336 [Streptomyces alboflavus]|uniref:Uncharacterized protein n=1 Tax=Streptomyces alboflavus TaxID=67267 RepID=A0A1Z1WBS6_9ACTN|nr:hypothetical protein SMD44_03336 [Streptomyces alboflavus]